MDSNLSWTTLPGTIITADSCRYFGYITHITVDRRLSDILPIYNPEDVRLHVRVLSPGKTITVTYTASKIATRSVDVSNEAYLGPIIISGGLICTLWYFDFINPFGGHPPIVQLTLYVKGIPIQSKISAVYYIDTWSLDASLMITPKHIKSLVDQATPINPSGKIYYLNTYSSVVSTNDSKTTQDMDVYIMFTSDLQEAYETANALLGSNIELIVIDPESYQDYISGKSLSFNAVSVHVLKQFVDITVPESTSSVYVNSGSAQIIEDTKTVGNYNITTYKAVITSPQYQLDLSDIYGAPFTANASQFTTTIDFPNCTFTKVNWTDDDGIVNFDFPMPNFSMPNITMPELEAPKLPLMYTYKIDILRSLLDSYIWRCEEYADFVVVVYRSDGLRLSSSSYKIVSLSISPSLEYTITTLSDSYRISIKLPQQDTTVNVTVTVEIDDEIYTQDWSFTVTEWGDRQLSGEVKTDQLYYDYESSKPIEVTVTIHDLVGRTVSGLIITDNWGNTYTDSGNGNYKATIDISKLPIGQYSIFVKINSNGQCYKNNLSDMFVIDKYVYNPLDFQNQDFKLTYPLVENVTVTINDNETTSYSITLNEYGEGILHINDTLNEGDKIEVKYQAYMSSTIFYVGSSKPISCTVTDEESITRYGRTPTNIITIPFLQSQEEACEIAEMYLKYYSKPTKIISTNNKW